MYDLETVIGKWCLDEMVSCAFREKKRGPLKGHRLTKGECRKLKLLSDSLDEARGKISIKLTSFTPAADDDQICDQPPCE